MIRIQSWGPDIRVADDWDLVEVPGVVVHQEPGQPGPQIPAWLIREDWGGGHRHRTGKRSGQQQGWNKYILRSLRDGRRSFFGRGHMMRSGK